VVVVAEVAEILAVRVRPEAVARLLKAFLLDRMDKTAPPMVVEVVEVVGDLAAAKAGL
jgi:hypothetical protein